jgi:hypothetical protein
MSEPDPDKEYTGDVYVNVRLPKDEYDTLKSMIKRDEAAHLVVKWIRAFLYVAVPLASLYAFYKSLGGQP